MSRRTLWLLILLTVSLGLYAVPYTTLGNIKVPYAYGLPHLMMEVSSSGLYTLDEMSEDRVFQYSGVLNIGLYDYVTLGFVYNDNEVYYANIKAQVIRETDVLPAVALGVDNLLSDIEDWRDGDGDVPGVDYDVDYTDVDDYIANSFYFVLSKSTILRGLPFAEEMGTVIHFGLGKNRFVGNVELSKQFSGFFGALELQPVPYMTFISEFDGYNLNIGLDFEYENFNFRTAVYRLEEVDRRDPKFAFNIMYTIDQFSAKQSAEKNRQIPLRQQVSRDTEYIVRPADAGQAGANPLQDQFEDIRARRERVEKQLEEIKKILEENKE